MALRRIVERVFPEPEPVSQQSFVDLVTDLPLFIPVRLFWQNLMDMRPWWPVLLPVLALVGWRAYQRERRAIEQRLFDTL